MARKCALSGKSHQSGHRVSHANNKTNHTFHSNLQQKRFFSAAKKGFIRVRVSTEMIRTIDKLGFDAAVKKSGVRLADLV